jgi:sRNA-binding protein
MIYNSFFDDINDDRELKEQTKTVSKQSKQDEKNTEEEIKQKVNAKKSKNDSKKREQVVFDAELSKVKISSSIKFQTFDKFVKCFIFEITKKNDFLS